MLATPLAVLFLAITSVISSPTPAVSTLERRDESSINSSITTISSKLTTLNTTVAKFTPSLLGTFTALTIVAQAEDLKTAINSGTQAAEESDVLDETDSLAIAGVVVTLANNVYSSLDNIVAKKSAFDKAILGIASASFIVKALLVSLRSATKAFGDALVAKLDESLQSLAPVVVDDIDAAFATAIAAYS
ncbi:hypothetical protein DV737_g1390, partial [Chaetothyriales sp. CBS 132003]